MSYHLGSIINKYKEVIVQTKSEEEEGIIVHINFKYEESQMLSSSVKKIISFLAEKIISSAQLWKFLISNRAEKC